MAATTVGRSIWTDDTGTPAVPAGDGTVVDDAELQKIYQNIDDMMAADLTGGGLIHQEGFGINLFSAGGTGSHGLRARNESAGTGNRGIIEIGNDADADLGRLWALASSYSATGALKQNGIALRAMGAGGLSMSAEHASGDLRGYAQGTSKLWTFDGETLEFAGGNRGACHVPMLIDGSVAYADVGNDADLNFDDLYSVLNEDGRTVRWVLHFDWPTGNSKDNEIYIGGTGGTLLASRTDTATTGITVYITITRTGSNTQRVTLFSDQSSFIGTSDTAETDSATIELLFRAASNASSANDVVFKHGYVEVLN